jgi:hypothetical protein
MRRWYQHFMDLLLRQAGPMRPPTCLTKKMPDMAAWQEIVLANAKYNCSWTGKINPISPWQRNCQGLPTTSLSWVTISLLKRVNRWYYRGVGVSLSSRKDKLLKGNFYEWCFWISLLLTQSIMLIIKQRNHNEDRKGKNKQQQCQSIYKTKLNYK